MSQAQNLYDDNELPDGPDDDDGLGRDTDQLPPEPPGSIGHQGGERAEYCLCRLCVCGVSTILTLDNDDPMYKVVTDHCRLGFSDAAQNEVQLCDAYWPRELSLAAWLQGRAVRKEARRRAKVDNDDSIRSFPEGRSPIPETHWTKTLRSLHYPLVFVVLLLLVLGAVALSGGFNG
jgi:hypothetical protein